MAAATSHSPAPGFGAPRDADRRRNARLGALISLPALVGLALALWFFAMRGSGVNGTLGAALAILGAAATLVGPMLAARMRPGGWRGLVRGLTVLAAVLSTIAGYFLMQYPYAAALALAALAAVVVPCIPAPERTA